MSRDTQLFTALAVGLGLLALYELAQQGSGGDSVDSNTTSTDRENGAGIGLQMIKQEEGCALTAYRDAGGWSIGYGHYGAYPGQVWTQQQADDALMTDFTRVRAQVDNLVQVPLTANQYAAILDFVYNIGSSAFRDSTFLRLLNGGDYAGASDQFMLWIHSGGAVNQTLVGRRQREQTLFNS